MEDILYKNSSSDVRIREMVSITANQNKHDYSKDYLTFEALEDGTFTFTMGIKLSTTCVPSIAYSTDNGETWITTNNRDDREVVVTTPTITAGNKVLWKSNAVQFRFNLNSSYPDSSGGYSSFTSSGNYNIEGNIMSLLYGDNFNENNTFKTYVSTGYGAGSFAYLFRNSTKLLSIEHLILPVTILTNYCYCNMFQGCTSLTTAPKLPATTLAESCYREMFSGCTSLTIVPVLPATTLAKHCYSNMFSGCTALTTTPVLSATILAKHCYSNMFYGCTSLTTVSELPATTLEQNCYDAMFRGCTSLTTAPVLSAITLEQNCYNAMFYGCIALTTAPELPATTLVNSCYNGMFQNCTNLNYIKAMFTTEPSTSYTDNWVNGVKSTGTFVKSDNATWNVTGSHGIPSGWDIERINPETGLPATIK